MTRRLLLATALVLLVALLVFIALARRGEHIPSLEREPRHVERGPSAPVDASAAIASAREEGVASGELGVLVEGCIDPAWGDVTLVLRAGGRADESSEASRGEAILARSAVREPGLVRFGRVPLRDVDLCLEGSDARNLASRAVTRAEWERGPVHFALPGTWRAGVRFVDSRGTVVERPAARGIFARQHAAPRVLPWSGATPARAPSAAFGADGTATSDSGAFRALTSSRFDLEASRAGCIGIVEFRACAPVDVLVLLGTAVLGRVTVPRVAPTLDVQLDRSVVERAYGSVRGRVRAREGALFDTGFEGVSIHEGEGRGATLRARWDADGRFEIGSLAPGRCWLAIEAAGRVQHRREIDVPSGGELDVGLVELVAGSAIVGRIVDEAGRPVAARVWTASAARSGRDRWIGSHPDAQGEESFYVLDLPREIVLVGIDDERYAPNPERFDLTRGDARDVVLVARAGVRVAFTNSRSIDRAACVRIVDASGVEVLVRRADELEAKPWRLVPGRYTARITSPDGAEGTFAFEVTASEATIALALR